MNPKLLLWQFILTLVYCLATGCAAKDDVLTTWQPDPYKAVVGGR